ncbi:MAG TPA: hypothetical protein VFJ14_14250 [Nocardioidaceae bacterium]|nr:hypothetical protein [Nocardioidaceae bacterium]
MAAVGALTVPAGAQAAEAGGAEVLRQAFAATTEAGTAHVRLRESVQVGERSIQLSGQGAVDFEDQSARLTFELPAAAGGSSLELRIVDLTLYLKLPPQAATQLTGGKPWAAVDIRQVAMAQAGSALGQLPTQNPMQAFEFLAGAGNKVTKIGTGTIDGVSVDHYRTAIDLAALASAAPNAQARESLNQLQETLGRATLPIHVWIDGDDLIRRVKLSLPVPQTGAVPAGSRVTVVQTLSDFGTEVQISAPPAGQTADITTLIAEQASQSGQTPSGGVDAGGEGTAGMEHAPLVYGGLGLLFAAAALGATTVARRRRSDLAA